jgi:hypothetical protein
MKVLPYYSLFALFCLSLIVHAQPIGDEGNSGGFTATMQTSGQTETIPVESAPLIEESLGLPVMRDRLTITESSQGVSFEIDTVESGYEIMMQNFSAALEGGTATHSELIETANNHLLMDITLHFIIEVLITLLVLKIAFSIHGFRFRLHEILPISIAPAFIGTLLNFTLNLSLLNPVRIGISFIIMLVMLRIMTEAHKWLTSLQVTLIACVLAIGTAWLITEGMTLMLGL